MTTKPIRYTTEQVLAGIQAFVHEDVDSQLVINPDASVNTYHEVIADSHDCPLVFLEELSTYFGLQWSQQRWAVWLRLPRTRQRDRIREKRTKELWSRWETEVAPRITVRQLAEFIARRAPAVSMEPVTIFGQKCSPAGVFLGLAALPEVQGRKVTPSTPLRSLAKSSRIREFWHRAEWISGASLPTLKKSKWWSLGSISDWIDAFGCVGGAVAASVIGWATGVATGSGSVGLLAGFASWFAIVFLSDFVSDRIHNPLPPDIHTFRDLAQLIASRPGA